MLRRFGPRTPTVITTIFLVLNDLLIIYFMLIDIFLILDTTGLQLRATYPTPLGEFDDIVLECTLTNSLIDNISWHVIGKRC